MLSPLQMKTLLMCLLLLTGGLLTQAGELQLKGQLPKDAEFYLRSHPGAESEFAAIADDKTQLLSVRGRAVLALLRCCDVNKYIGRAIDLSLAQPKSHERVPDFSNVTNIGDRLFRMNQTNREAFLKTGFSILASLPEEKLQDGYFVARHLGFFLQINGEFAPDQSAKEYQGENGLTKKFFADTTKNALLWYSTNRNNSLTR
jgi:hypothetical protein